MLLGQLFYYEKEISRLGPTSGVNDFLNVEIASVNTSDLQNLKGGGALVDFTFKLKELFIQNYLDLLIENQLHTAVEFWKLLTSPLQITETVKTSSEFQAQLLDWVTTDGNISNLKINVLNTGVLSSNQEDFALYYGLHVLYQIYLVGQNTQDINTLDLSLIGKSENLEFNNLPEILIIANTMVKPLIENLDCVFIDNSNLKEDIANQVSSSLAEFESIKLIIVDSQDPELLSKIKKSNPKNVLITELNFSSSQENNFFDALVKQTLGIKLN